MTSRILAASAAVLFLAGCSDSDPVAPSQQYETMAVGTQFSNMSAKKAAQRTALLQEIPVVGTLVGGGTFKGLLSITELAYEDGDLLATGKITGTITDAAGVTNVTDTFTDAVIDLTGHHSACGILNLDIPGGLLLDVLGLVVDLAPLNLDVRAERGPGNLLGNLLCGLTGLLDAPAALGGIFKLIDRINGILDMLG